MLMLMLLCSAVPPCAASPEQAGGEPARSEQADPDWILARIARPGAISTAFVELRGSALLKAPLRVQGRYARAADATLVREVTAPYREKITLTGEQATLERDGKPPRTFPLARAPELAELRQGFGALLSGDAAQLQQRYTLSAAGTRQAWQLRLDPKDLKDLKDPKDPAAAKSPLREIQLHGQGAELRCIETTGANGEPQRTLLAGAAQAAADVSDGESLVALCRGRAG